MRENVGVLSPNEKEGVMNRGLSLVRIIRSVRSWRAWSWPVAGICSLVALSLSCLQTAMADELLPSIAIERAGAETSDVSSPSIAETTGAWAARPLLDGKWEDLTPEQAAGVVQRLRQYWREVRRGLSEDDWPLLRDVTRFRQLPLPCYTTTSVVLVEGEFRKAGQQSGIVTFLLHNRGVTLLTDSGGRGVILDLNHWNPPQLGAPEYAVIYAKLFIGVMSGARGDLRILEDPNMVEWRTGEDRRAHGAREQGIRPVIVRAEGKVWVMETIIQSGTALVRADLVIEKNGWLRIVNEHLLESALPIKRTQYTKYLRYESF